MQNLHIYLVEFQLRSLYPGQFANPDKFEMMTANIVAISAEDAMNVVAEYYGNRLFKIIDARVINSVDALGYGVISRVVIDNYQSVKAKALHQYRDMHGSRGLEKGEKSMLLEKLGIENA
ncbi:hypothetical protein [Desulfocurvibacter africanus]|uniref:hypothetical protein n=1 Tax=Desulfocurvibacter africanus TaxID=873 RepID=UPI0004840E3F|nr:hypothetical protein [Desulfocurvibacter africanus]